jgi:hypothetical protein
MNRAFSTFTIKSVDDDQRIVGVQQVQHAPHCGGAAAGCLTPRGDNRGMSLGEFDLIGKYFTREVRRAALGIGDDCALLAPSLMRFQSQKM